MILRSLCPNPVFLCNLVLLVATNLWYLTLKHIHPTNEHTHTHRPEMERLGTSTTTTSQLQNSGFPSRSKIPVNRSPRLLSSFLRCRKPCVVEFHPIPSEENVRQVKIGSFHHFPNFGVKICDIFEFEPTLW